MVFLSFSFNNIFKFFLIFLLSLFCSGFSIYAQVKIKEKIKINPEIKLSATTTEDYSPIVFQFGGPSPFSFVIESPSSSVSGSNAGRGAPFSVIEVPAVNGNYKVTVSSSCECQTNVGYSVTWIDPYGYTNWIAGYEMWFYGPQVREDRFTFNRIPDPIPFDFSILLSEHLVFGTQESIINFWYKGDDVTDKSVTLSLANSDPDVIFFDIYLQQNIGNTFTTTLDDSYNFSVKSNSVNTSYPKHITVIAVSNGLQRSDTLMIEQPNSVRAYFEKENLSPGDTVNIIVKKVDNQFGWESDYPDTTHFEVGIKNGCGLGLILDVSGEKKDYFRSIQQPIRFIVADSLKVDADSVVLRVGAPVIPEGDIIAGSVTTTGNILQKNKNAMNLNMKAALSVNKKFFVKALDDNSCTAYDPVYKKNFDDAVAVVKENTILLGETKYYGLSQKVTEENTEYKIEEIQTDYGNAPGFPDDSNSDWRWLKDSDVWGENPVTKISGIETGIYWEKKDSKGNNLSAGLIRLIGRYWDKDNAYKIRLTDKDSRAKLDITIKKPSKLLNPNQNPAYDKYEDVDGTEKNVDDLCIEKGGKYGILPQILKGQIFQEAAKIKGVFYPSYRYEPFTTQWDKYLKYWSGRFYFNDLQSTNYSDVPNHSNVQYISYYRVAKSVWDIINEGSQLKTPSNPAHFGKRNSDHTMNFYPGSYKDIQPVYDEFLNAERKRKELTATTQADSANAKMAKWFQNDWMEGKAKTEPAQTRCASSYGLLQMMYTTACSEKDYPISALPENLNTLSQFENWVQYQKNLLGDYNNNNWDIGFEGVIKKVVLAKWNRRTAYPKEVLANSKMFLPQK